MLEQRAGEGNIRFGRLPRLADVPIWQLITIFALAFMNASWGVVAFRIIGALERNLSASGAMIYIAGCIFLTYLWMIGLSVLRFREDFKRFVTGIWLLLLIGFLPAILYPQLQASYYLRLERYISRMFQLSFLFTPEFLGSLIVIYFWQLGLNLSNHWTGTLAVSRSMRVSTILMITLGFAATNIGHVVPVQEIFLLLFSGLIAMGGARISSIGFKRGGSWIPFSRSYFVIFSLSATALISLSLALTFAVGDPIALALNRLFTLIGIVSSWVVVVAFGPVFVIILELVERILARLKPLIGTLEEEIAPTLTEIQLIVEEAAQEAQPFSFADRLNEILGVAFPILGILLALLIGYYALKRTRAARLWRNLDEEQQESLIGSLPDLLKAFLQGGARSGLEVLAQLMPISRVIAAARIRQIYRQLLHESARLGKPREQAETPLEFLPQLQVVFPDRQAELSLITNAYLMVRYGEIPETPEEVQAVERAWRIVRQSAKDMQAVSRQLAGGNAPE
jgi:hypothetical protein